MRDFYRKYGQDLYSIKGQASYTFNDSGGRDDYEEIDYDLAKELHVGDRFVKYREARHKNGSDAKEYYSEILLVKEKSIDQNGNYFFVMEFLHEV